MKTLRDYGISKKETRDIIKSLDVQTLRDISEVSPKINYQGGLTKTGLLRALNKATTEKELDYIHEFAKSYKYYSDLGMEGILDLYMNSLSEAPSAWINKYCIKEGWSPKDIINFIEQNINVLNQEDYEGFLEAVDSYDRIDEQYAE